MHQVATYMITAYWILSVRILQSAVTNVLFTHYSDSGWKSSLWPCCYFTTACINKPLLFLNNSLNQLNNSWRTDQEIVNLPISLVKCSHCTNSKSNHFTSTYLRSDLILNLKYAPWNALDAWYCENVFNGSAHQTVVRCEILTFQSLHFAEFHKISSAFNKVIEPNPNSWITFRDMS